MGSVVFPESCNALPLTSVYESVVRLMRCWMWSVPNSSTRAGPHQGVWVKTHLPLSRQLWFGFFLQSVWQRYLPSVCICCVRVAAEVLSGGRSKLCVRRFRYRK